MVCTVTPDSGTFASSFIAYADCQARTVGEHGYLALAASGSNVSQLITILLTILIAIFGYRLLLGATPTLREGVMTLVKVGFTVAFATGWPAYQAVVYDVAIMAPGELGATIGAAAGLPGTTGDLPAHLDVVDQQFQLLAIYNANRPFVPLPPGSVPPPLFAGFDVFGLGAARVVFLVGAAGGYVVTRLIAGLLLALGPLFIAFLLFDATRGLVEGWVKVLSGAVLGTLATSIVLGIELAFLEPWLSNLIAIRGSDTAIPGAAAQLLAATTLFAIALLATIAAAARLVWSLRFPFTVMGVQMSSWGGGKSLSSGLVDRGATTQQMVPRSRARSIADAVTALDRRDAAALAGASPDSRGSLSTLRSSGISSPERTGENAGGTTGGIAMRRRVNARISASAQRRDRMS